MIIHRKVVSELKSRGVGHGEDSQFQTGKDGNGDEEEEILRKEMFAGGDSLLPDATDHGGRGIRSGLFLWLFDVFRLEEEEYGTTWKGRLEDGGIN